MLASSHATALFGLAGVARNDSGAGVRTSCEICNLMWAHPFLLMLYFYSQKAGKTAETVKQGKHC